MENKKLKPILERANVTNKLRDIRTLIEYLKDKTNKTAHDALKIQRLKNLEKDLKREHIFLIVDNT